MHGLYIHIPFCNYICTYCDFKKELAKESKKSSYIDAIINEIKSYEDVIHHVKTIYIGGGTPLSLSIELLDQLLSTLNNIVDMSQILEFTIETNPDNIEADKILLLMHYGVNRLSIGVQTTSDRLLKWMGRPYNKKVILEKIQLLKDLSFKNYSVDMIFGLPFQTNEELDGDLQFIKESDATHVSYYNLIIEENSVLGRTQSIDWQDDDRDVELYQRLTTELTKTYEHYEISNFAKSGYESQHNLIYWTMKPYLGVGVSAHSFNGTTRSFQTYNTKDYIAKKGLVKQSIESTSLLEETVILGLRLTKGVSISHIEDTFKIDLFNTYPVLHDWINKDFLKIEDGMLLFTDKGFFVQNELFVHIVGE